MQYIYTNQIQFFMKKIFTLCLGAMLALSAFAAEQQVLADTVKVEANNLYVEPHQYFDMYMQYYGYGPVQFQGKTDDWTVAGIFMATDTANFYGEYSGDALIVSAFDMQNNSEEFELTCTSFKYELTEKGDQITALGTDSTGRVFDVKLTFFAPETAKDTVTVDFGEVENAMYVSSLGGWYLFAENEDFQTQLFILTEDLEGTYTYEDFFTNYTGVFAIQGTDTIFTGVPFDVNSVITLEDGVYQIAAEIFAGNETLYQFTMQYTKPVAADTVQLSVEGVELMDYTEKMGLFILQFGPEDQSYFISLSIVSSTLEGTFTDKDLDYEYSFIKIGSEYIDIAEAELTSTLGENGVLTLQGWLLGKNGVRYEITVVTAATQAINNTEAAVKVEKRIQNGVLVIEKNGVKYNAQGAILK